MLEGKFIFLEVFIFFVEKSEFIFFFGEWFINEVCDVIEVLKVFNLDIRLVINIFGC